jgi:hypothetical protein
MEALQQRHEELTKRGEEAAVKGDASKSRRMERLSKVFFFFLIFFWHIINSLFLY